MGIMQHGPKDHSEPSTPVLVLFALFFTPWLIVSLGSGYEAYLDSRKVEARGLVIDTRVVKDERPSAKRSWYKEWLVEYAAGGAEYRQWLRIQAYGYEREVERAGDVGKTLSVWYDPDAPDLAEKNPPNPLGNVLAAFVTGFAGVGGVLNICGLIQRLTRRCP